MGILLLVQPMQTPKHKGGKHVMATITMNLYERYARQLIRELGVNQGTLTVPAKTKFTFTSVEGHPKVTVQMETLEATQQ